MLYCARKAWVLQHQFLLHSLQEVYLAHYQPRDEASTKPAQTPASVPLPYLWPPSHRRALSPSARRRLLAIAGICVGGHSLCLTGGF